jgi:hypothetical protein
MPRAGAGENQDGRQRISLAEHATRLSVQNHHFQASHNWMYRALPAAGRICIGPVTTMPLARKASTAFCAIAESAESV